MQMQPVRVIDVKEGDHLLTPMFNGDNDEDTGLELAFCEFVKVTSCELCKTDDTAMAISTEYHEEPILYNKEKILVRLVQTSECETL